MSDGAALEQALATGDVEERRREVARLRTLPTLARPELLLTALGDVDWRVRKEAVLSLVAFADKAEVLELLLGALRPNDNVGLRNSAVEALASCGVSALPSLARALGALDPDGRKLVVDVLCKGGRPESLPLLRSLVRDPDVNVRGAAVEAVATVGNGCAEEAIAILDACLDAPEPFVRLAALDGLNRLGAILPWERLAPLVGDPVLGSRALIAAARCGAEPAADVLLLALGSARDLGFSEVLGAIIELARTSPAGRARLQAGAGKVSRDDMDRVLRLAGDELALPQARRHALGVAGLLRAAAAAVVAVSALSDDALAEEAELALAELGSVAVPALVAGADGSSWEQRAACIALLGPMAAVEPDAAAAAKRALQDPVPEVVAAALDALSAAGDRSALGDAARLLSAGPRVTQAAHRALVALARRHPADAEKLVQAASPKGAEAEAAAIAIEVLGPGRPQARAHLDFLAAALDGPFPSARAAALSALSAMVDASALEPVAFALSDEEPLVRLAAVRALGRLRGSDGRALGVERLTEVARSTTEVVLAAAAARALGEVADSRAAPVLSGLIDRQPILAVAAIEALSRYEQGLGREAFTQALGHADTEVVKTAMRALSTGTPAGMAELLAGCLDHREWDVRRLAAELMGSLGGDTALAALRGRLSLEAHDLVCEAIAHAIAEAEGASGRRRTAPPPSLRGVPRR
ncbi:MAG: HEAT repeat domain-containing protein [Myxococcales bacterium]|nr:HEAT repeat domain-containing protein [Myxococcales bacterium]